MGVEAHVVLKDPAPEGLAEYARLRLRDLDGKWTRFDPGSELCRYNRGELDSQVSSDLDLLLRRCEEGRTLTNGLFDARVLEVMVRLEGGPNVAPGIDSGGIGKGLAADLVTEELIERGATGALVNVGGDLRARGTAPRREGWSIRVSHPLDDGLEIARLLIGEGAVATSTPHARTWDHEGTLTHHLIDPRTSMAASTGVEQVTVLAEYAWQAEVLAKAAFLLGPAEGASMLAAHGAHGLLLDVAGVLHLARGTEAYLI